jgi:hypothetical protein
VPGRDVGINMADGRVRFDQRAADVEGDDARGGVRKKNPNSEIRTSKEARRSNTAVRVR